MATVGSVPPVVEAIDLKRTYRTTTGTFRRRSLEVEAVRGVSFEIAEGELFGLLGPNGAGKSTLIKILLGIVRKTDGEAELLGRPAGKAEVRKHVGYLPEDHQFPQYHTAASLLLTRRVASDATAGGTRRIA